VIRAVLVLAVCGAVWLSVRGQHPYKGPTAAVLPVVLAFVVLNFGATVAVAKRATAGVSGRSRLRRAEITVMAVAWIAAFVVMGALAGAGGEPRDRLRTVPGHGAADGRRPGLGGHHGGTGELARMRHRARAAAVGAVGAFAGPAGAWAVAGVGLCVTLLGTAAAIAWQQRRRVVQQ